MANRDLLKEAIADAKAVKETAIANAKAALEEVFTPLMQEKFAMKIAEMELEEEEVNEAELEEYGDEHPVSTKDALSKVKTTKEEMDKNMEESMDEEMYEAKEATDEVDLEELLRELDEMDDNIDENLDEAKTEKEDLKEEEDLINNPEDGHGNITKEEEKKDDENASEDEEIDLENMSEDDLKSFIESVIADMVTAGELEGNINNNDEDEDEKEIEVKDEDEMEVKEVKDEEGEKVEEMKKKMEAMKEELDEAYSALETIKTELNEVNLFNAKLLYTNKIFKAKNLTESQKVKVLAAFDKAASVKEAKLVFETLSEGFKEKKSPVNESLLRGSASKPAGVVEKKPIMEINDQFARWQTLAGIKK